MPYLPERQLGQKEQSIAHPLAEVHVTPADKEAIDAAMQHINERRQALAEQRPHQVFAGIVAEGSDTHLLVIDYNRSLDNSQPYLVRTARVGDLAAGMPLKEEYVPSARATRNREPKQTISTELLGDILTGSGLPATFLEKNRAKAKGVGLIPFAQIRRRDGKVLDAVALEDAFSPVTERDQYEIARRELDFDALRDRYPRVVDGRGPVVKDALRPYVKALESDRLDEAGRQRIVGLGRQMMEIANKYPENVTHGTVLNPEEAAVMAEAEEEGRNLPEGGIIGRKRRRAENQRQTAAMVYDAQDRYLKSLHEPSNS